MAMAVEHDVSGVLGGADEVSYRVGAHLLRLSCAGGRWSVRVDDVAFERWYTNQAGAWEAGVREADRLDRVSAA